MAIAPAFKDTPLLLDNDVFTHWRNQHPYVINAIRDYTRHLKSFPKLPAITIFEAKWGIEKGIVEAGEMNAGLIRQQERIEDAITTFGTLDFNYQAASIAAYVFARLSKSQRNEHWKDVFIAATALSHGYGLATQNRRDFELIGQHLPPQTPILYMAIWKQ